MAENSQVITIMLDPKAKKVQLALRIGALPPLRAGRRREFPVSALSPYAKVLTPLAKDGSLKAYGAGLKPISADDFVAMLGGSAPAKPASPQKTEPTPSADDLEPVADAVTEDVAPSTAQEEEVAPKPKRTRKATKAKSDK